VSNSDVNFPKFIACSVGPKVTGFQVWDEVFGTSKVRSPNTAAPTGRARAQARQPELRSAALWRCSASPLCYDPLANTRYELELQLGATDESHIIRTIEYWNTERRRRWPQYDHVAVIVAEEITARFFNVISLFNAFIPIIAIQMSAIELGDAVTLVFSTVLGRITLRRRGRGEG
jgi:hypothetical protein